eukprot:COSAG02_NODE_549_length_20461_cov_11.385866_10_plen_235_part_00
MRRLLLERRAEQLAQELRTPWGSKDQKKQAARSVPQAPESGAGECEVPARPTSLALSPPVVWLAGENPSIDTVPCGMFHSLCIVAAAACQGGQQARREDERAVPVRVCEQMKYEDRVQREVVRPDPPANASLSAASTREGLSAASSFPSSVTLGSLLSLPAPSPSLCVHSTGKIRGLAQPAKRKARNTPLILERTQLERPSRRRRAPGPAMAAIVSHVLSATARVRAPASCQII